MSMNHRRTHIDVSRQYLPRTIIHTGLQRMDRKTERKRMRSDSFHNARRFDGPTQSVLKNRLVHKNVGEQFRREELLRALKQERRTAIPIVSERSEPFEPSHMAAIRNQSPRKNPAKSLCDQFQLQSQSWDRRLRQQADSILRPLSHLESPYDAVRNRRLSLAASDFRNDAVRRRIEVAETATELLANDRTQN